jgi:hypothetical protein
LGGEKMKILKLLLLFGLVLLSIMLFAALPAYVPDILKLFVIFIPILLAIEISLQA